MKKSKNHHNRSSIAFNCDVLTTAETVGGMGVLVLLDCTSFECLHFDSSCSTYVSMFWFRMPNWNESSCSDYSLASSLMLLAK